MKTGERRSGKISKTELEEERKRNNRRKLGSLLFTIIPPAIPLMIRLGITYLRLSGKAKKAGKVFEKQLISNGISREEAKVLTDEYLKISNSIRRFDYMKKIMKSD